MYASNSIAGAENMALYKVEGIVLRRRILGESDRIVTIFGRNYGKISAVAKGARKPKSRLGGRTEPFIYANYLLAEGRNLDIITQAELIDGLPAVRGDLYLTAMATYFIELVDSFTEAREAHDDIFDLLWAVLRLLEGGAEPDLMARIFEVRLMSLLGYRPQLERCARCSALVGSAWRFDVSIGGLLCRECRPSAAHQVTVSADAVRLMRLLLITDIGQLVRAGISEKLLIEIERVMGAFIDYRSESRIRSREFLMQVREERKNKRAVTG